MIDPLVRRARPADSVELAELEGVARAALVDQRGGVRWLEENPARVTDWANATVFVAVLDELVVGYLELDPTPPVARVAQVYVRPETRELGFGDELLATAIDHARAAGADRIEGEALPGDRTIKNLYERAGITARLIVVSA
ncbi:MAG: GNAT family N-acetyltransferase, partial [Ilumatobacteraceae bacterium]